MSKPIDLRRSKLIGLDQIVIPEKYFDELKGILIPEGYLNDRIARLGQEISNQLIRNKRRMRTQNTQCRDRSWLQK